MRLPAGSVLLFFCFEDELLFISSKRIACSNGEQLLVQMFWWK